MHRPDRSLTTTDDIRAEIDAIRGRHEDRNYRARSRAPVSPSNIRRRTGTTLIVALAAIVLLAFYGLVKLAWGFGMAIIHIAWPSHSLAKTALDWLL